MKYETELRDVYHDCVEAFPKILGIRLFSLSVILIMAAIGCNPAQVETSKQEGATQTEEFRETESAMAHRPVLTRIFWQDRGKGVVYSGDLFRESGGFKIQQDVVEGFPELSMEKNDMVQMAAVDGAVIVGVRDKSDGTYKSGWIEIATGVEEESHGDHSHWHYDSNAKVRTVKLDEKQGNPAHVYHYGKFIYIANDKNNGFTQVRPSTIDGSSNDQAESTFFGGGGGHITLAAVGDRIAYSSWIDRKGENAGRVDVVDLRGGETVPSYSFHLDRGGIHGAAACGNRVFFAPSHGVCWVDCDFDFALNQDTIEIHSLSLDQTSTGTDYRTGAFECFENHLLCIANSRNDAPALCVIDGTTPSPKVLRVSCGEIEKGMRVSSVRATHTVDNRSLAFAFAEGTGQREKLLVFDLDPDQDRDFSDAVLHKTIDVGRSQLEGHFGHHGIAFLDDHRTAVVSNPGDGTLAVLNLEEQEFVETIHVGGQPTHLVCHGGPE